MKKLIEQFKSNWKVAGLLLCLAYYVVSTSINDFFYTRELARLNNNLEELGIAAIASQQRVESDTRQWRKEAQDNLMLARYNLNLADSLNFRMEKYFENKKRRLR